MTGAAGSAPIRAAGGLVIRGDTSSTAEVAVVHRPRYDDWSLPKGKHDQGESAQDCAVREVEEETGYRCRVVAVAGTTRYRVGGEPKEVAYFVMRPLRSGGFRPDDEVDEMRWVTPREAVDLLTYDFDRELVGRAPLERAFAHTTLHVVRHAAAGSRSRWAGPDFDRPLTSKGMAQAKALADELDGVGIARIVTSPYARCAQSVAPLGEHTGRAVELSDDLAEGARLPQIRRVLRQVAGTTAVLCSHGDVIPAMLEWLEATGTRILSSRSWPKGSTWVVGHDGTSFGEAVYLPPPTV